VVLDDAHMLDARSLNLVIRTAQAGMVADARSERAIPRLLFVLAMRSLDASHSAMPQLVQLLGLRGTRRITLGELSADQTTALAAARLGVAPSDLPAEVGALVRARAGGNPLFAEELITTLRDEGVIRIETAAEGAADRPRCIVAADLHQITPTLPDTLQGLILGRIDVPHRKMQRNLHQWK
jgi:adenylate cyclase